jgi:hypothetical protein
VSLLVDNAASIVSGRLVVYLSPSRLVVYLSPAVWWYICLRAVLWYICLQAAWFKNRCSSWLGALPRSGPRERAGPLDLLDGKLFYFAAVCSIDSEL